MVDPGAVISRRSGIDTNRTSCAGSLDRYWCGRAVDAAQLVCLSFVVPVGAIAYNLSGQVWSSSDKQLGAIFRLGLIRLVPINRMTIQCGNKILP
jgi:hypothetical protein